MQYLVRPHHGDLGIVVDGHCPESRCHLPLDHRFLLGFAEAGMAPGLIYYMTIWFPKRELSKVISYYYLGLPLSSIIAGPLSGLILDHMNGIFGLKSWQWLFILEGIPATVGLLGPAPAFDLISGSHLGRRTSRGKIKSFWNRSSTRSGEQTKVGLSDQALAASFSDI